MRSRAGWRLPTRLPLDSSGCRNDLNPQPLANENAEKYFKIGRREMNATMVASGTKAVPPVVSSIQDIPLAKIRESKTNPRRLFDEPKLAELAENITQHGVLQPILVRPLPNGEA